MNPQIKTLPGVGTPESAKANSNVSAFHMSIVAQEKLSVHMSVVSESILSTIKRDGCNLDTTKAYISTDAEWNAGNYLSNFGNWIQSASIVLYYEGEQWKYRVFVFTSDNLPPETIETIRSYLVQFPCVVPVFTPWAIQTTAIERFLTEECEGKAKTLQLILKFSPLDCQSYFGTDVWLNELVLSGVVEQKRCLRFNNESDNPFASKRKYKPNDSRFQYELRDLQGLNMGSLKKQAESVNVRLLAKNTMDEYKLRMYDGYIAHPLTATMYNICDALANLQIMLAYIPLVNQIMDDIGLPKSCHITEAGLKHTTGALDGDVLQKYIEWYPYTLDKDVSADDLDIWRLALRRYSIIRPNLSKFDQANAERIADVFKRATRLTDFKREKLTFYKGKEAIHCSVYDACVGKYSEVYDRLFQRRTYEQASVQYFGSNHTSSGVYAALVQGGRCNNSMPHELHYRMSADADMESCYGSTLRDLFYPVGLPTTITHTLEDASKPMLFKQVYEKIKGELVDECWVAGVDTTETLTFMQDLIYSSLYVTPEIIHKSVGASHYSESEGEDGETGDRDQDLKKIPSEFALLRSEIENGILTSNSLAILERVATDQEKRELWTKLRLKYFSYYPRSQRVDNPIEWAKRVLKDKGGLKQANVTTKEDNRSRYWFPLPLEGFVGTLVNLRKTAKKQMSDYEKGSPDYSRLNARQEMLKLFINTTYGILASVYFGLGNTVLANVITDKARAGAWKMSKSLRTREEITDGGHYCVLAVAFHTGTKKPGLDVFARPEAWVCRNGKAVQRVLGPLGGVDWEHEFEQLNQIHRELDSYNERKMEAEAKQMTDAVKSWHKRLDKIAMEHVENFWKPYGLTLGFDLAHKEDNTAWEVGYFGKSDYCFRTLATQYNGTTEVIKKRGAKELSQDKLDDGYLMDPSFDFLRCLAANDLSGYKNLPYHHSHLLRVAEFTEAKDDPENPEAIGSRIRALVPGWDIVSLREPRQMNNKHLHFRTKEDFERVHKRKGFYRGKRVQWFDRYSNDVQQLLEHVRDNKLD